MDQSRAIKDESASAIAANAGLPQPKALRCCDGLKKETLVEREVVWRDEKCGWGLLFVRSFCVFSGNGVGGEIA